MKKRMRHRWFYVLALTLNCFLWVGIVVYGHYGRYVRSWKIEEIPDDSAHPPCRNVSHQDNVLIGRIYQQGGQHFSNRELNKPKERTRIGCFGCSFTQGSGVSEGFDIASLMQDMFVAQGQDTIEVINFGLAGGGMHQSYLLWERVGKKFNLDVVIVGPLGIYFSDRDAGFLSRYAMDWSGIAPLHARYILRGEEVLLIEPLGESLKQQLGQYLSFIPDWRYIRYEIRSPAFIACLIPPGRQLQNPFYYYRGNVRDEMLSIYRGLFRKMAATQPVIIASASPELNEKSSAFIMENSFFQPIGLLFNFPYETFCGHQSPNGNDFVARQYRAIVSGSEKGTIEVLRAEEPLSNLTYDITMNKRHALHQYHRVDITVGGIPAGCFSHLSIRTNQHLSRYSDVEKRSINFQRIFFESSTVGLLAVKGVGQSITEACFFSVNQFFDKHESVSFVGNAPGGSGDSVIASWPVQYIDAALTIGIIEVPAVYFKDYGTIVEVELPVSGNDAVSGNVSMLIGETVITSGSLRRENRQEKNAARATVHLCANPAFRIRARGDVLIPVERGATLPVELVLTDAQGGQQRYPLTRFTVREQTLAFPGAKNLLSAAPGPHPNR